jgi:membrane dipeptidase
VGRGSRFPFRLEPAFSPVSPQVEVSERAEHLHRDAIVVDLHVDSLLWPRDLTREGEGGQADFPRMRRGGLDAVALTIPTRFFGVAGLKALHDRWPARSLFSPWERLRAQLAKSSAFGGEARLATDAGSIRRNHREETLSYFHGIEGAHALERDLGRVPELRRFGIRFVGLVHLSANEIGGSSSGSNRGLTGLGRELIGEMNREGLLVDLAHASEKTFFEALALTDYPPLVSHSGVRAVHDRWRNLSDEQIRAVAEKRGVVGVMLAPPALSKPSLEEALRHIEHLIEIGGEEVAAIGSDFDGYVRPPIDVSGLPQLTELMLRREFQEDRIRKILGENALRALG